MVVILDVKHIERDAYSEILAQAFLVAARGPELIGVVQKLEAALDTHLHKRVGGQGHLERIFAGHQKQMVVPPYMQSGANSEVAAVAHHIERVVGVESAVKPFVCVYTKTGKFAQSGNRVNNVELASVLVFEPLQVDSLRLRSHQRQKEDQNNSPKPAIMSRYDSQNKIK